VVDKLLEGNKMTQGFDANVGEYCDLIQRGIIDPTKVVRTAITDSCGVASLMITTEASIVDIKDDNTGENK
jgi:chaperonin GroEL